MSAAVWWISLTIAAALGAGAVSAEWRWHARRARAAKPGRPAVNPRLGHQNLAWPPHGQRPVTGPPPSVRHLGPPPAARSLADTDWALWAEEMNHR